MIMRSIAAGPRRSAMFCDHPPPPSPPPPHTPSPRHLRANSPSRDMFKHDVILSGNLNMMSSCRGTPRLEGKKTHPYVPYGTLHILGSLNCPIHSPNFSVFACVLCLLLRCGGSRMPVLLGAKPRIISQFSIKGGSPQVMKPH